jgi:hypothetical protein
MPVAMKHFKAGGRISYEYIRIIIKFVIRINARAKRPPATLCVAMRAGIRNS